MNSWLTRKYINIAAIQMRNFKWEDNNLARCSCPICGDSEKDKTKARFYFIESTKGWHVFCHNCQYSGSFDKFLKKSNTNLYTEYRMELFKELGTTKKVEVLPEFKSRVPSKVLVKTEEVPKMSTLLDKLLDNVSTLSADHIAVEYVTRRMIPKDKWSLLYYVDDLQVIVKDMPKYRDKVKNGGPRLVMPCINANQRLIGFINRALDPNDPKRYMNLTVVDETQIFGMDRLDTSKPMYCLEGPIDSLFLPNAIAMSGTAVGKIKEIFLTLDKSMLTVVLDNQPRNKEVLSIYNKTIENGYQVFIPPKSMPGKDLNDCVMSGMSLTDLQDMIDSHTYQGMTAKLKFSTWKEI